MPHIHSLFQTGFLLQRIGVKETIPFGEYMIVHILKVNPPVVIIQYKSWSHQLMECEVHPEIKYSDIQSQ